jgi:hypothetical protein
MEESPDLLKDQIDENGTKSCMTRCGATPNKTHFTHSPPRTATHLLRFPLPPFFDLSITPIAIDDQVYTNSFDFLRLPNFQTSKKVQSPKNIYHLDQSHGWLSSIFFVDGA